MFTHNPLQEVISLTVLFIAFPDIPTPIINPDFFFNVYITRTYSDWGSAVHFWCKAIDFYYFTPEIHFCFTPVVFLPSMVCNWVCVTVCIWETDRQTDRHRQKDRQEERKTEHGGQGVPTNPLFGLSEMNFGQKQTARFQYHSQSQVMSVWANALWSSRSVWQSRLHSGARRLLFFSV